MKQLFTLANGRFVGMIVAIVILAQLASVPVSRWLQKEGLPR